MDYTTITYLVPVAGVLALLYAFMRTRWVTKQDVGTPEMADLAKSIAEGARAFLRQEYRVLVVFVIVVAALLAFANLNQPQSSWMIALSFIVGAFCSALAGFIGMNVATKANVRTTQAARTGLAPALNVAFSGGLVMGLSVVGLGLLGLGGLFVVYSGLDWTPIKVVAVISGFSLGASSIALFARVGGGIYTPTWPERCMKASPRTTRATRLRLPTTWATTSVTLPGWAPTCSNRMWDPSSVPWCWVRRSWPCRHSKVRSLDRSARWCFPWRSRLSVSSSRSPDRSS
jgi:hypothetical protein